MTYTQRKLNEEFPFHISGRCNNRDAFPVPLAEAWEILSNYLHMLHHNYEIKIHSFVMMPNHFHLIASDPGLNLSHAMSIFMRETSKEMGCLSNRINRVWGSRFHSCLIQDDSYFTNVYKYNYRNPVTSKICDRVEDYPWSSLQILLGKKRGIIPLAEDQLLMSNPNRTLEWLNEEYFDHDAAAIKLATQKKIFELRRDAKNGKQIRLQRFPQYADFCQPEALQKVSS